MHECLKRWEHFLNNHESGLPELIQCAIIHEHFEAIHPFLDGNGRIGRLLITLFLVERRRLSKPLLYVSTYIEQHRTDYYNLLQRIRTHGAWSEWIRYFLTAVRESARSAINQSQAIFALRDRYRHAFQTNHRALSLLDSLFINPYTTVTRAREVLGVTAPTAQKTIDALVRANMLKEATGRGWGRYWLARPILKIVEAPIGSFSF
jgi:Fic family protein